MNYTNYKIWFERVSMLVILLNCVTLGMYQPCTEDILCKSNRCKILQIFDDYIFAFFALEMTIKMIAMGVYGKGTYLADSWNRLDFIIVLAGPVEYALLQNLNLSAIRTIRVLRPLRAINRIPSMRILVMLLLDTLPMLGNVLLLCFFVFFIFGIVGVQLWEGTLRQRCFANIKIPESVGRYYRYNDTDPYICSKPDGNGMHLCENFTASENENGELCTGTIEILKYTHTNMCVNWNQYYTICEDSPHNPFLGTISFDNIGLAWVAIFLVISLEGWTDIMYYVQDAHSFWDWIYFVLLIVIGSFFMINLCLVVIATQFAETKKREMERMRLERERFRSTSTLASSTNNSEPTTCYAEIVKYVAHLWRRGKRRIIKKWRLYQYRRQQQREHKHPVLPLRQYHRHPHRCPHHSAATAVAAAAAAASIQPPPPPSSTQPSTVVPPTITHLSTSTSTTVHQVETGGGNVSGVSSNGGNNHNNHANNNHQHQQNVLAPPAPRASPEASDTDLMVRPNGNGVSTTTTSTGGLLRVNSNTNGWPEGADSGLTPGLLSTPSQQHRRRSSVMFSDIILLHSATGNGSNGCSRENTNVTRNICSSEKMTQTGDGWLPGSTGSAPPPALEPMTPAAAAAVALSVSSGAGGGIDGAADGPMTCQELLALSGALSAALPTGQIALDSFFNSLAKGAGKGASDEGRWGDDCCHCCCEAAAAIAETAVAVKRKKRRTVILRKVAWCVTTFRKHIRALVEHKYFQQGILVAILINTLSMGVEYHDQPDWLTTTVEVSNIVFSAIFAVEMLLKIIADGLLGYVSNGFNVFDGVIVVLSLIEMCQAYLEEGASEGSSGLSVLRTFRLLRILKLVRFMPNLRRQLFVMLRTMDNVAVFFSLLILFIFIFSILGMYLFGGKFCMHKKLNRQCTCSEIMGHDPLCECDRKHFNNILWATVTVFQILTQEDWNIVLFNGMKNTSHWAALYFVALMTFGNYVLFNLLVAILVEGFSAERNERREREQRELAKQHQLAKQAALAAAAESSEHASSCFDDSRSSSQCDSYFGHQEMKNKWRSAEELRKACKDNNGNREKEMNSFRCYRLGQQYENIAEPKCNIEKESKMLCQAPIITHTAATPQDSPNTTLEPGMRDFAAHRLAPAIALYSSTMSIDSIDRSTSSQCSIPGLLKPPPAAAPSKCNNLSLLTTRMSLTGAVQLPRAPSPPPPPPLQSTSATSGLIRRDSSSRYTWRLSRPSLGRKSSASSRRPPDGEHEDGDAGDQGAATPQSPPLNNHHALSQGIEHSHWNGNLIGTTTIRNDTQSSTPNNNRHPSPTNLTQVAWVGGLARQNSLTSQAGSGNGGTSYPLSRCNSHNWSLRSGGTTGPACPEESCVPQKAINTLANIPNRDNPSTVPLPLMSSGAIETVSPGPGSIASGGGESKSTGSRSGTSGPINPGILKYINDKLQRYEIIRKRDDYSLYLFHPNNKARHFCVWFVNQKWFDNIILMFIGMNCITLAMERPNIPPDSLERTFLASANYVFTGVFAFEMLFKVVATGMLYGETAYFTSGWNVMDGTLVTISIIDLLITIISASSPRILGILRVFRLLRSLRPLRVINRAPGLKLVVQTLLSSLRPIGNIVLICCTFFIIFGILGVQLFKGTFYYCEGPFIEDVKNKEDCEAHDQNEWVNQKYNFDDLGKALMSLFVLSSRDGWVNIMYTGLDAVGVDQEPIRNHNEWRLLYFIAFILLVGFFVLNMFVGVVVENFHRCREEQEKEERILRMAKRAKQMEKKRRKMHEPPYYTNYSQSRKKIHDMVTSKYFDLAIAAVIGLNVVTMAMEYYRMPNALSYALKIFNYFFTAVFILESVMKLVALGLRVYFKDRWNQLDVAIVILSVVGIVLEELESNIIPINPTIMRVMRVLRIARVLKLLKMAKGIRALLDTVMQALPQVGNLGLLFFLLFFIFAALGVELFGRIECTKENPCQGLGEHAHFKNFGMAFLTLFRVATGDNWNGIMKDTLRTKNCSHDSNCVQNCCASTIIAPIFFVIFVLMAQFVLVNVVVAVLMKHLEESHKQMEDENDMEKELKRELEAEQDEADLLEEEALCLQALELSALEDPMLSRRPPLAKVLSLPANFTFRDTETNEMKFKNDLQGNISGDYRYDTNQPTPYSTAGSAMRARRRRQTLHAPHGLLLAAPSLLYRPCYQDESYAGSDFSARQGLLFRRPPCYLEEDDDIQGDDLDETDEVDTVQDLLPEEPVCSSLQESLEDDEEDNASRSMSSMSPVTPIEPLSPGWGVTVDLGHQSNNHLLIPLHPPRSPRSSLSVTNNDLFSPISTIEDPPTLTASPESGSIGTILSPSAIEETAPPLPHSLSPSVELQTSLSRNVSPPSQVQLPPLEKSLSLSSSSETDDSENSAGCEQRLLPST